MPENLTEAKFVHSRDEFLVESEQETRLNNYLPTFRAVAEQLRTIGGVKIRPSDGQSAQDWLMKYINRLKADELVLIVSHLKDQDRFTEIGTGVSLISEKICPLIDGTSAKISEYTDITKPLVWTIGCDTWDYYASLEEMPAPIMTTSVRISYPQSVFIAEKILRSGRNVRSIIYSVQRDLIPVNPPIGRKPAPTKHPHLPTERPNPRLHLMVDIQNGNNIVTERTMIG